MGSWKIGPFVRPSDEATPCLQKLASLMFHTGCSQNLYAGSRLNYIYIFLHNKVCCLPEPPFKTFALPCEVIMNV